MTLSPPSESTKEEQAMTHSQTAPAAGNFFDLTGKVALVTGSSRGIGNIIAHSLATAGATVVLNGLNQERALPRI
jgi:3-oxoacyl-ACP reductase-like protein